MIELMQIKPEPIFDDGITVESQIWDSDLRFEKGKYYLVTAPSGKGKSTLLHIIYGLRKDFTGQLKINSLASQEISNEQWSVFRQSRLSIVFQDLRLFQNLSAKANIQLNGQLDGSFDPQKVEQMAKNLGVSDLLDKACHTLSYGQRQRIAIIRALCQPFDFLLLDEPFSHLDEANTMKACQLIDEVVREQKASLILVSLGERFHFQYDEEYIL